MAYRVTYWLPPSNVVLALDKILTGCNLWVSDGSVAANVTLNHRQYGSAARPF